MNLRRGLFWLWVVGSALFVLAVAFISYGTIKRQFDGAANTFEVQLPDGRTFEVQAPDMQTATAMVRTLPKDFVPDKPLRSDAVPNPWASLGTVAAFAFGIPLAILALGSSLLWALSGFAVERH
jgi:hypothetical protein